MVGTEGTKTRLKKKASQQGDEPELLQRDLSNPARATLSPSAFGQTAPVLDLGATKFEKRLRGLWPRRGCSLSALWAARIELPGSND